MKCWRTNCRLICYSITKENSCLMFLLFCGSIGRFNIHVNYVFVDRNKWVFFYLLMCWVLLLRTRLELWEHLGSIVLWIVFSWTEISGDYFHHVELFSHYPAFLISSPSLLLFPTFCNWMIGLLLWKFNYEGSNSTKPSSSAEKVSAPLFRCYGL